MGLKLATPGVYIEEKSAFPNSVVAVATAVPAFVGYTEQAMRGNKSLNDVPTRITSLEEFHQFFGKGPAVTYSLEENEEEKFKLTVDASTNYLLYNSLRLFFANGGSTCYIVSVGKYGDAIEASKLNNMDENGGLRTLLKEPEPTMLVIPDALLLEEQDCFAVYQAMLMHCGTDMQSRVALLDVYAGEKERTMDDEDVVTKFREGIGNNNLKWGASYYPWVESSVVQANELTYKNISTIDVLEKLIQDGFKEDFGDDYEEKMPPYQAEIDKMKDEKADVTNVHQTLATVSSTYKDVMAELRNKMNVLPPAAGMAGVISMVDNNVGVFKSPANVSLGSVVKPSVNITNEIQQDLNVPLNGKAVNAIRSFPGKGVLVWGARTLDANSLDWRYLSVRRTIIMIEQSLKYATEAYVFEPNVVNTWVTVKGMMTNFLADQWKQGALAGATPQDAFSVDVGLGVTMTPTDILEGIMKISIKLAVVRPAEFIVITIQQQMQKS